MSASGSAPKTCANNDKVILEDARLDQLYCDFIVEKNKRSDEGEMAQRHKDHSSDDSQEQMKDSEATYTDPRLMTRQDNPASFSSLSNLIPSIQRNAPQYNITRYNGMTLNESSSLLRTSISSNG